MATIIAKKYIVVFFASMLGAMAHAFEEIQKSGWKGWVSFVADIFVCNFVGFTFYHFSQILYPDSAVFITSLGSYWGTRGFVYLKMWFINSVKSSIK